MGREVERMLAARGHETVLVADEFNPLTVGSLRGSGAEVAVEFTTPDTAFDNVCMCLEAGVAVVCGTTGWLAKWDEAVELCGKLSGAMFYASNYSIGVNLLFRLNEQLARMMKEFPQYTPSITEVHHIHKKDAPSGTAITLAEGIVAHNERYGGWELAGQSEASGGKTSIAQLQSSAGDGFGLPALPCKADKIYIDAIREGEVPGMHTVRWESEVDVITMTHEAFDRRGLAAGAAMATEFLHGRRGVFSMEDIIKI